MSIQPMNVRRRWYCGSTIAVIAGLAGGVRTTEAQTEQVGRPRLGAFARALVAIDTAAVALTHVRVIDGTGAPARADQTLVIRDGRIVSVGPASSTQIPAGAQMLDLTGKTVIPGLVMVHEHLYYPTPDAIRDHPAR
jgi:hypothetical protein